MRRNSYDIYKDIIASPKRRRKVAAFSDKPMTFRDVADFLWRLLKPSDIFFMTLTGVLSVCISLVIPYCCELLFRDALASGSMELFSSTSLLLIGSAVSLCLIVFSGNMLTKRLKNALSAGLVQAILDRLLRLPSECHSHLGDTKAFLTENSAKLANAMCSLPRTLLCAVFFAVHIGRLFHYSTAVALTLLIGLLVFCGVYVALALYRIRVTQYDLVMKAEEYGFTHTALQGIERLIPHKDTVAEHRAKLFSKRASHTLNPPFLIKTAKPLLFGIIVICIATVAAVSALTVTDGGFFAALYATLLILIVAATDLVGEFDYITNVKPLYKTVEPILKAQPEPLAERSYLLEGAVSVKRVTFAYDTPLFNDLSFRIKSGEKIAVFGSHNTGKSTLCKLLMGGLKPQKGVVCFDNTDINTVSLDRLRAQVFLLSDRDRLLRGSILYNVTLRTPEATESAAMSVLDKVGIGKKIRLLPKGIHTVLNDNGRGISESEAMGVLFARMLLADNPIVIIDGILDSLDQPLLEKAVGILKSLSSTVIVTTSEADVAKQFDRTVTLNEG